MNQRSLIRVAWLVVGIFAVVLAPSAWAAESADGDGWISLFDGKSLDDWTASEGQDSFEVENGLLRVRGARSHLFYTGPVQNHDFKNFELKLEVMAEPMSNSGVYFHTKYQEFGFPDKGFEAQVNRSQGDSRLTGSLYAVKDIGEKLTNDNEWFEYHIIVRGKQITIKVNGKTAVDYTEEANAPHLAEMPGRKLSSGTFALQAHDPESSVYYRNIRVLPLP